LVPGSCRFDNFAIFGARGWQNMPTIAVGDENKANTLALHYLNTGADGILFIIEKMKLIMAYSLLIFH
jgi:hypothetical protein